MFTSYKDARLFRSPLYAAFTFYMYHLVLHSYIQLSVTAGLSDLFSKDSTIYACVTRDYPRVQPPYVWLWVGSATSPNNADSGLFSRDSPLLCKLNIHTIEPTVCDFGIIVNTDDSPTYGACTSTGGDSGGDSGSVGAPNPLLCTSVVEYV